MTTPTTERKSRGARARAARREEILAAARAVFARQGFRGTTIADIAEEAGIALGTIYLYFRSKEDVFAALNEHLAEIIVRALVDVPETRTMEESVRSRVNNVFAACAKNRDLIRLVVLNMDRDSVVAQRMHEAEEKRALPMVRTIAAGVEAGAVRPGDPVIMTKLTHGAVTMAVYQAFVLNDGRDWEKYRDACGDMLVAYFTPPAREQGTGGAAKV
jgi:AcrR family transcriptional regulator